MTRYTSHELRTEQREIAREMRRGPTSAEARLWERLRARRLNGLKFSRQHPIGRFIVDLYCVDAGLVIELDGSVHDDPEQRQADVVRQQFLESQGVRVLRFPNAELFSDIDRVLATITEVCANASSQAPPLHDVERGPGGEV